MESDRSNSSSSLKDSPFSSSGASLAELPGDEPFLPKDIVLLIRSIIDGFFTGVSPARPGEDSSDLSVTPEEIYMIAADNPEECF